MYRPLLVASIAFFSLVASFAFAPEAHARPTRISGQFGAADLYPKTLARLERYKAELERGERSIRAALRRGDERTAQRLAKKLRSTLAKAKKALKKVRSVRGVTTVVVWGDAGDVMPRSKIAAFLRKNRSWQGRTVHFYARQGELRYGGSAPRSYDDRTRRNRTRSTGGSHPTTGPFGTQGLLPYPPVRGGGQPLPNPGGTKIFGF